MAITGISLLSQEKKYRTLSMLLANANPTIKYRDSIACEASRKDQNPSTVVSNSERESVSIHQTRIGKSQTWRDILGSTVKGFRMHNDMTSANSPMGMPAPTGGIRTISNPAFRIR